jgi:hypothetical protein
MYLAFKIGINKYHIKDFRYPMMNKHQIKEFRHPEGLTHLPENIKTIFHVLLIALDDTLPKLNILDIHRMRQENPYLKPKTNIYSEI